jgi:hypothetical protein
LNHRTEVKERKTTLDVSVTFLVTVTKCLTQMTRRKEVGRAQWLVPIISATQEREIGRIIVQDHPKQKLAKPHLNQQVGYRGK